MATIEECRELVMGRMTTAIDETVKSILEELNIAAASQTQAVKKEVSIYCGSIADTIAGWLAAETEKRIDLLEELESCDALDLVHLAATTPNLQDLQDQISEALFDGLVRVETDYELGYVTIRALDEDEVPIAYRRCERCQSYYGNCEKRFGVWSCPECQLKGAKKG